LEFIPIVVDSLFLSKGKTIKIIRINHEKSWPIASGINTGLATKHGHNAWGSCQLIVYEEIGIICT